VKLAEKQRDNAIAGVNQYRKHLPLFKDVVDTLRRPSLYNATMLEGKCPKCGTQYFGWALQWPRHQTCSKCGIGLEITQDGQRVFKGYSPFTAEKYSINLPSNVPPPEKKQSRVKNE